MGPSSMGMLLWCLLFSQTPSSPVSQFNYFNVLAGIEALEQGNYLGSLALLEPLTQQNNEAIATKARFFASQAAFQMKRYKESLAYLQGLETTWPEIADVIYFNEAQTNEAMQAWPQAVNLWQKILNVHPTSPYAAEAAYRLAALAQEQNQWQQAIHLYQHALLKYPNNTKQPWAQKQIADLFEKLQQPEKAILYYRKVLQNHSDHRLKEAAWQALKNYAKKTASTFGDIRYELQEVDRLIRTKKFEEADSLLQEIRSYNKENSTKNNESTEQAMIWRQAVIYSKTNQHRQAIEMLLPVLKTAHGSTKQDYLKLLANSYTATGSYDAAIRIYLEANKKEDLCKTPKEYLLRASFLAYGNHQYNQAIGLFRQFSEHYKYDRMLPEVMWYWSWNAFLLGDQYQALLVLQKLDDKFHHKYPADQLLYWRAQMLDKLHQTSKASEIYQRLSTDLQSYYGILAHLKLYSSIASQQDNTNNDWDKTAPKSVGKQDPLWPNSLDPATLTTSDALYAMRLTSYTPIIFNNEMFNWQSYDGRRTQRLVELGMYKEAAQALLKVPAKNAINNQQIHATRAQLLSLLGDYAKSYQEIAGFYKKSMNQQDSDVFNRLYLLAFPKAYENVILQSAEAFNVSPWLLWAVMRQESAFNTQARSSAQAKGLMQIIPATAQRIATELALADYQESDLHQASLNIHFGSWYLAQLHKKFKNNAVLTIASYNAGPQAVERWVRDMAPCATDVFIENIPYKETRHYVKNVITNLATYQSLYSQEAFTLPQSIEADFLDNIQF